MYNLQPFLVTLCVVSTTFLAIQPDKQRTHSNLNQKPSTIPAPVHIKPVIDGPYKPWELSPIQFLDSLKTKEAQVVSAIFPARKWISIEDLRKIAMLIDDQHDCAAVVSVRYSGNQTDRSTIGAEAIMMVHAHQKDQYPPALTAEWSSRTFGRDEAMTYLAGLDAVKN
jgi:hypothetical protein